MPIVPHDFAAEVGQQFFKGRHTAGYWFWELETLPEIMHSGFAYVDEVWTASRFVQKAIAAANQRPVFTIPLPMSVPICDPSITRAQLGIPERFCFLFMFDFFSVMERKNPLGLVNAFVRAFKPNEGPVLVIKCINGHQRLNHLERLRAAVRDREDIVLIDGYYGGAQKNALMSLCDCYVSLHRSEGLGLTMAEAMGLGKPVIATAYSGNLDFMTTMNSYLVDYVTGSVPPGCEPYPIGTPWAEPDLDAAAEAMRLVFEQPAEAAQRGLRARHDMTTRHGVEAVAPITAARLEAIRAGRRARMAVTPPPAATPPPIDAVPALTRAADLLTPAVGLPVTARLRGLRLPLQRWLLRALRPDWWQQRQLQTLLVESIHEVNAARAAEAAANRTEAFNHLDNVDTRLREVEQRLAATTRDMSRQERETRSAVLDTDCRLAALQNSAHQQATVVEAALADTRAQIEVFRRTAPGALGATVQRLEASAGTFQQNASAHLAALTDILARVEREVHDLTHELRAVPYMANPARFLIRDGAGQQTLGYDEAPSEEADVYPGFEDVFRGSEELIREMAASYVPLLRDHGPVLDIGCGRGELLGLLRDAGIEARGVDTDAGMVRRCRAQGLDVLEGDGLDHLEGVPEGSLGAINATQVIEHLPYDRLLAFLRLSHSRLKPGGLLIVETVNPHSIAAFKTFWTDLTHKAPIFPEVALVLCWLQRFRSARVVFLNGSDNSTRTVPAAASTRWWQPGRPSRLSRWPRKRLARFWPSRCGSRRRGPRRPPRSRCRVYPAATPNALRRAPR